MKRRGSPNFDARPPGVPVDMLVLHYTGMRTAADALARLCDAASKVSAHYLIDSDGAITALVDEASRAWHAGVSFWRGQTDINARSVGIELVNPGHEYGYVDFSEAQMAALIGLASEVLVRHPIMARNVVGHADVAPRRKVDPGERFDWARLAAAGIGLWPGDGEAAAWPQGEGAVDEKTVAAMLADYGYETDDVTASITAFQRHFRPARCDGVADGETAGLLKALLRQAA